MSNALATTTPVIPERFANPLRQVQGVLAQPAVRRTLPMILMVSLIIAAGLAWMTLRTPSQKTLFSSLGDSDKAAVTQALTTAGVDSHIDDSGAVTVAADDYNRAKMLLAGQGLPKAAPAGYALLDDLPMGASRAVEGERLRQARETELARSIEEIDAVADARVHLAMPEESVFVRDSASPSASVILRLEPGRALGDAQVASIVNLVASSVPGMKPDDVTIVDQMGTLLSKPGSDPTAAAGDQRIDLQHRVEDKYRQQLIQLLTPLVGAGNFTTEVQADIDLDATQATRESYDKQGALRAEQGNWTGNQKDGPGAPGGIPGALSNTPPGPTTVAQPGAAQAAAAQPVAGGPAPDANKQSDEFARSYDLGKEVTVTQGTPGAIKRLSVAVLLRDPDKGHRTAMEIGQVTDLVKSAVGFDASRNDQVTVISRKFADSAADADATPWYQAAWLPMVLRNVTALVIAVLVLLLGVRPLAKALLKKRDDAAPRLALGREIGGAPGAIASGAAPVGIDALAGARNYDDRIGAVRGFTRDNPARAALAVRDMIKSDAR